MGSRGSLALAASLCFLAAATARGAPIVSVDLDPIAPGIQASRTVALGSLVQIEVAIAEVEPAEPLHAFELDLSFDPSIVSAISLADGGFLGSPTFLVESDLAAPDVNYALTRVGTSGVTGAGVLLSIVFEAIALGTTQLLPQMVLLSAPDGMPILDFTLAGGALSVVPEPSSALLLALALAISRVGSSFLIRGSPR